MSETLGGEPEPKLIQQEPISLDDLSPYRGQWVKIREGHVIASDLSPDSLNGDDRLETDSLMLVPHKADFLILGAKAVEPSISAIASPTWRHEEMTGGPGNPKLPTLIDERLVFGEVGRGEIQATPMPELKLPEFT